MSIDDYLAELPGHRRQRIGRLLELIRNIAPQAGESLKYKMPTFVLGDGWIAVGNQKHYISLYTCSAEHIAPFSEKHPKQKTGKGCINFKDSNELFEKDLERVVRSALKLS